MVEGLQYHNIIENIFPDTRGLYVHSQLQTNCPVCTARNGGIPDEKFNLEISTFNGKHFYRCWCCEPKFSGSLGKLIRKYGSRADYELYKSYAGSYFDYEHLEEEKEYAQIRLPDEFISFSEMDETDMNHLEAYNYMICDRKLSRELIYKYHLGFCVTGKYKKRIIVPSYDLHGEINYFVGRTYDPFEKKKKYDNPKSDKNKIIFNEGFINWDSLVFLVEGAFDMFSLPNAIPMLGKTISSSLYFRLKELKPDIVILLDPDAYKNSINLYYTLQTIYLGCEEKVKIVKLPNEDDVDELRKHRGVEAVVDCLYTARGLTNEDYFAIKLSKSNGRY
jgi:DNA primase